MSYQQDTIDGVRSIMAPANPMPRHAPAGSATDSRGLDTLHQVLAQLPQETARPGPRSRPAADRRARRVAAPLAAGLAVVGLVTALTLVARAPKASLGRPAAGAPAAKVPAAAGQGSSAHYVTLAGVGGTLIAAVHSAQTGQVLSQIRVPGLEGTLPNIAASPDGSYVINGTLVGRYRSKAVPALYRLRVSADGRSEQLRRLPVNLPAGPREPVEGLAVSPDGTELAVALLITSRVTGTFSLHGEIALYPLTGGGPTRTWTVPGDARAMATSPDWISSSQLAFVWQDQLHGSANYFLTGDSQIRVLDTSAPGTDLLASRLLLNGGGKLGFIQTASVGPSGFPITVATFRVTSIGASGTATMLLAQVSPSGTVEKTFARYIRSYSGFPQEGTVTTPCQVLGTNATGQHTLAACPDFGRIDNGAFTALAHSSADHAAAW